MDSTQPLLPQPGSLQELESIRTILFAQEQARIQALEEQAAILSQIDREQGENLHKRAQALQVEIDALQEASHIHQSEALALQTRLEQLRIDIASESEALIPRLTGQMSGMISATIRDSRDEMAEALGPVMGEAIRVQIRDSSDDMVEALYPIILSTVQRAIAEFARELQRNIDARLKTTFGPQGLLRNSLARIRGVSTSELAFRDALPFAVLELFLIQHESGLLMAHLSHEEEENNDNDLISGMLTAIRDFSHDTFGDGSTDGELDEIQYGDERITIQSGQHIYLAVVTTGVEPEWFRARLRSFASELHIQHAPALRDYSGDPATLPDVNEWLTRLSSELTASRETQPKARSRGQKLALAGGGLLGLLLLATACFYLQFTIALWPLAFGSATPTQTATQTAVPTTMPLPTATAVPLSTSAPMPAATFTPLPTATPTTTPEPTHTVTATSEPTITNTPIAASSAITNAPVWMRQQPDHDAAPIIGIPADISVTILAQQGDWVEIEWLGNSGLRRGWISIEWLTFNEDLSSP